MPFELLDVPNWEALARICVGHFGTLLEEESECVGKLFVGEACVTAREEYAINPLEVLLELVVRSLVRNRDDSGSARLKPLENTRGRFREILSHAVEIPQRNSYFSPKYPAILRVHTFT